MSSSNYCFLICIQEPGKVVLHSHLFKNFPQFLMIHTVKGLTYSIKQKSIFFWNSLAFSVIQQMLAIWSVWKCKTFSWRKGIYISFCLWLWVINQKETQFGSLSVGSFSATIRCHLGLKSFKDLTELWFYKEIPRSVLRVKEHHGFNLIQKDFTYSVRNGAEGESRKDTHTHTEIKAKYWY